MKPVHSRYCQLQAPIHACSFSDANRSIPMPTDSALPEQAHVRQIRLFFSGGPQVALYGSPSTVADGWIANLPAAEVFAGDFSNLLYEVLIDAQDAHQRAPFHTPFYEQTVRQAPQPSWPKRDSAAPARPDPELARVALRHLNTARVLATRLAQQARRENRPEDQQRFLAAAADASIKAADLEGDAEGAEQLREQALRQATAASTIASRLALQAKRDKNPYDHLHFLTAAADCACRAIDLNRDDQIAIQIHEQALKQLTSASSLASQLALKAGRSNKTNDQLRLLVVAGRSVSTAANLLKDGERAAQLRLHAAQHYADASTIGSRLALLARKANKPLDEQGHLEAAADSAMKVSQTQGNSHTMFHTQALMQFTRASALASRLARQAQGEANANDRLIHLQHATHCALEAAALHPDAQTASRLRAQASRQLLQVARIAMLLAKKARREGASQDQLIFHQHAADATLKLLRT